MSELETKAVEILNKMESLTEAYAPEVLDKAVQVMQLSSVATLVNTIVLMLFGVGLVFAGYFWNKYCKKRYDAIPQSNDWDVAGQVGGSVSAVFGSIMAVLFCIALFDVWMWIGIFDPETALAYKILGF